MTQAEIQALEQSIAERAPFERLMFHVNPDTYRDVKSYFYKYEDNKIWLQNLIYEGGKKSLCHYELYGKLLSHTGDIVIKFEKKFLFSRYLLVKGIIKESDFDKRGPPSKSELKTAEEYEHPIRDRSIEYFVLKDSLEHFLSKAEKKGIDIFQEHKIKINEEKFNNLFEFACYCGANDIFKHFVANNAEITYDVIKRAIEGESEDFVKILMTKHCSANPSIDQAIEHHNNRTARWISATFTQAFFRYPACTHYFNSEMTLFFLNNQNRNINEQEYTTGRTALHWSVLHNDLILAKYLVIKGIDMEPEDLTNGKPAASYVQSDEMKAILGK